MVQNIKSFIVTRTSKLREQVRSMDEYLKGKHEFGDYHGVADASMDIREYNAEINGLDTLLDFINDMENAPRKKQEKR